MVSRAFQHLAELNVSNLSAVSTVEVYVLKKGGKYCNNLNEYMQRFLFLF